MINQSMIEALIPTMKNTAFKGICTNPDIQLDNLALMTFGEYVDTIPLPAMCCKFDFAGYAAFIIFDSSLIYSMVDVLSGGRRGTAAMRIEGRGYTTIEKRIIKELVMESIVNELLYELNILSKDIYMEIEHISLSPDNMRKQLSENEMVQIARMRVDLDDRGGRFELCVEEH